LIALLLAIFFTSYRLNIKGQQFFKTVVYMPNLIMASAFSMLFFTLFSPVGPVNQLLTAWGLADTAIDLFFGGKAKGTSILSCHIGSGASLCAIRDGKCVATTMGLTPLGGVMMGTRTGDIDPSVMDYLCNQTGKSVDEMYDIFNKKSGLLGVSGVSNDTRDIEAAAEKGNERAMIASKLFARRIADFIGSYFVRLGHVDVIIFSAGIGENSSWYRKLILENVQEALDLKIDWAKNDEANGKQMVISKPESKIKVCVIPTDEEVMIARDCLKEIEGTL
jgi:acetate kinase